MNDLPSSEAVRVRLEVAAKSDDPAQRADLVAGIARAYRKLWALAGPASGPSRSLPSRSAEKGGREGREPEFFAAMLATDLVENDHAPSRMQAAMRLARQYAEVYRAIAAESEASIVYGGRSGTIAFVGKGSLLEPHPRLIDLIDNVDIPTAVLPQPAATTCRECGYRVDVRKPAAATAASGAGLDPDFLAYLRRTGQAELISLAAWSAHDGLDPADPLAQDAYGAAQAAAWEAFERELYQQRYCRPSDLPAANIVRGHRLLRLDTQLCVEDFRPQCENAPAALYEGLQGPVTPPELDYEELVRRYVLQLRRDIAPTARPISEQEIAETLVAAGLSPDRTTLFVQASWLALHLPSYDLRFWEDLRARLSGGAPVVQAGGGTLTLSRHPFVRPTLPAPFAPRTTSVTPASSPAAWLMGAGGQTVRSAVERLWQGLLPDHSAPAAASALGIPSNALPAGRFRELVEKLAYTVPLTPWQHSTGADDFYGTAPGDPNDPVALGQDKRVFAERVRSTLSEIYEAVWSAAHSVLGEEGLSARMLQPSELRIEFGPREFDAHLFHAARHAAAFNPWNSGVPLRGANLYRRITEELSNEVAVPVSYKDVVAFLDAVDLGQPPPPPNSRDYYLVPMQALVDRLATSYENALDVVLTLSGSQAQAAAAPLPTNAPAGLSRADIPALYNLWAQLFWRVIERLLSARLPIGDDFFALRLSKRVGRFGELPRRPQSGEIAPEPKDIPWPNHPSVETEAWMLEPVPRVYYETPHPGVYLQELHALSLRSRGYGIGSNLYSVSLLPKEEQKVVIKSFKDTTYTVTESTAENIFEETSSESERDFGEEVARESQRESTSEEAGHVGVKASGGIPLFFSGSTDASYDAKSGARDFAKDVSNVTSKLANKLSAKRSVSVETKRSTEQKVELHSELNTERTLKNPNLGHTVSYHWFQMTRKYLQRLELEDARMVYTSGRYNVARVLVPRGAPVPGRLRSETASELPPDVAQLLPTNVAVVVLTDPYRETVPLAGANAFLARVLRPAKAVEVTSTLWRLLGESESAPDGLGVLAFSEPHGHAVDGQHGHFVELFSDTPEQAEATWAPDRVAADRIEIAPKWDRRRREVLYLPNLDLRYTARDGQPPSRYSAHAYDNRALPRLLASEERIVNTNGVYCDAMVGQCTALEDYLERSRDLDLLEKKIQVGQQEIQFRWEAEKDGLDVVLDESNRTLVALVAPRDAQPPFERRVAVEDAQQRQRQRIAEDQLERQRLEAELAVLQRKVDQLQASIGQPQELRIDAPEGSNVSVEAKVRLDGGDDAPPAGTAITVE